MSVFSDVKLANPIEVFALTHTYNNDTYPQKVNLGVGGQYLEILGIEIFIKTKSFVFYVIFIIEQYS